MLRRVAAVTKDFIEKVKRSVTTEAWRSPAFKAGKKYLTVHVIKDPADEKDPGYYYVERVGKDSVGFLLWDEDKGQYGCLQQWHGPLNRFNLGTFTGSRDKDELDAKGTTQEEAIEEAGYHVDLNRITHIGTYAVSANTNEEVDLFIVDVTGLPQERAEPENIFEQNTFIRWLNPDEIGSKCEWKAIVIAMEKQREIEGNLF